RRTDRMQTAVQPPTLADRRRATPGAPRSREERHVRHARSVDRTDRPRIRPDHRRRGRPRHRHPRIPHVERDRRLGAGPHPDRDRRRVRCRGRGAGQGHHHRDGQAARPGGGEVKLAASIYRWYGENGPGVVEPELLDVPGARVNRVTTEPIGPLVGVMPWNYPYYQVARFAAPNLLLGNTIILKHAGICARSSAAIEKVQRAAGLPEDAYVNVYASTDTVAEFIADPRVRGVSLTGSERAGASVATVAAENLTKSVLELGGSDPLIVLDSSDPGALV